MKNNQSKHKQASHNNPKEGQSDGDNNKTLPADNKSIWVIIAEVIGVFLFGTLANICFSIDHKVLGIWFSFVSICSGFAIVATSSSRNYSPKHVWRFYSFSVLAVGVLCLIWTYSVLNPTPEKTPNLKFFVSTEDEPGWKTALTNDCFKWEMNQQETKGGALVMPLRGSNVVMKFFIMNESSIPAEAGSVMVAVDTNVSVFFADPGWGRFESDAEFLPGFVGRTMDLPTLAHDSGIRLPEVTVLSSKAALEGFNVAIRASAKSGPDASAAIRVIFLPDKRLKRPVVLQGRKNKDGKFEVNPLDALK